jgi:hypothetical protein
MQEVDDKVINDIKSINIDSLKRYVSEGDTFIPRAHIFGEDNIYVVFTPFKNDEEKIEMLQEVGKLTCEKKAHQIVFVSDTTFRKFDKQEDYEYALQNISTERPSVYPEGMRLEAILIYLLDFKDHEKERAIILPYKKEGKVVIMLDEPSFPSGPLSSSGAVKSSIAAGIIQTKMYDILKRKEIIPENFFKMEVKEVGDLVTEIKKEIDEEYPRILATQMS